MTKTAWVGRLRYMFWCSKCVVLGSGRHREMPWTRISSMRSEI
ncbi:unnamed protein product [Ciceribacter selenitireducens ATCC BAA-1503]|uniref:Uncharacterized protein n=1 Tax=Ciceribacter selenitireducens ATCC BAA-1503 TaxID=1336235 RepID=A0A376AHX9_9HYPH|nr:unnamed protein product [Ciceribacter selenitireducens ATCC BAA-1503]